MCARAGIVLRLQGPQRFSPADAVPALLGFLKLRMPPATVILVLQTRAQRASNRRVAFAALEELLGRCSVPALRLELLRACAAACRGQRGLHFLEDVSVGTRFSVFCCSPAFCCSHFLSGFRRRCPSCSISELRAAGPSVPYDPRRHRPALSEAAAAEPALSTVRKARCSAPG